MKKFSTFLCMVLCSIALHASVVTGTCGDNLTWSYDTDTKALTIEGTGDMSYYAVPWEQVKGDILSVSLPEGLTSIGSDAFSSCSSLTSIILPNSVTSIGSRAFYDCSSLTSITIPNSVTSIGSGAFAGCSSLTSIVVESGNTMYDSRENCNAIIETASNTLIAGCQSTTIPNSVTSIGVHAFRGCSSLTSVTIPNSVTSIGKSAFKLCSSIADIYCYPTTPPACDDDNTFSGVNELCNIHVPAGTIPHYQVATGWSYFSNFLEISEEAAISETEQQNKSSRKIIRDGQVLILRNGVTYDMMGNTL